MVHFIEKMPKKERKEYRDKLRNLFIASGGRTYTNRYIGKVFAIEPSILGDNCKTFRVAIAYCNPNDKFKQSIGEAIALYRLSVNSCIVIRCDEFSNTNQRMNKIADNFNINY